jgi:hypothetical protein
MAKTCELALRIVTEYEDDAEILVPASALRDCARLGAALDFDLYWYPSDAAGQAQSESAPYIESFAAVLSVEPIRLGSSEMASLEAAAAGGRPPATVEYDAERLRVAVTGGPGATWIQVRQALRGHCRLARKVRYSEGLRNLCLDFLGGNGGPPGTYAKSLVACMAEAGASFTLSVHPRPASGSTP